MLTPRRTLMLLGGFVLFSCAYLVYAQFLGWLDGLPQLPDKYLIAGTSEFRPPDIHDSPTQVKLALAFGPKSPETDYALYETQVEFRNGESSFVLAAGPVPANPNSNRVTLSPFSLAIFSKPKPAYLRQPGEVQEISTIHSDKAILEFDRVITNANEMRTAKLLRMELVSDFQVVDDPRRGTVHITNNQKSADPDRFLVVKTPGPVFYRDPKAVAGTPAAQGPDFWTDAGVEIVDRQNLPRPIGSSAPVTAVSKSEELRNSEVIADIIAGRRAPPPTVTAVGLRIYLEPDPPPGQPRKKTEGTLHGVRRLDFLEQVLVNLWIDNGQSMVGGSPPPDAPAAPNAPKNNSLACTPPPAAIAAVGGNMATAAYTARLQNRALLQVDTRGPFAYDAEKSLARFDVVPHSDPNLTNDVQVTKVPVRGGMSSLFSQVLELEFNNGPTTGARPAGVPPVKRLHAWTSTPGQVLTVASQDDSMVAYGQDLVHEQAANRTILVGAPLRVLRERNILTAGNPQRPATLISEPGPAPPAPVANAKRKSQITVRGPGQVELFDAATNATTITAYWLTSLVQTKEVIGGREQDLFTFTDGAKFDDRKSDYWLEGTVLRLWLESPDAGGAKPPAPPGPPVPPGATAAAPQGGGQAKPSRILAVGNVKSHSSDYDVEQAEQLNVYFADAKPVAVAVAPPVSPQPKAAPMGPPAPQAEPPVAKPPAPGTVVATGPKPSEPAPKEPEKPKPPMKIRARTIDTWVTRMPVPPPPPKPGARPAPKTEPGKPPEPANAVKYQLDKARCEDNVVVHQDPTDPAKPRGVDILGRLLLIDGSADGSIMTVYGWHNRPGEVHQEETSILGPEVIIDQVHNAAAVKGRGALTMPTNSDISGGELAQAEVVVIHWRDSMEFKGAQRSAKFEGKVSARQGESWVLCNTMHVVFDRPIYFNQAQKKAAPPSKKIDPKTGKPVEDKAKIDTVYCYPAAADSADEKGDLTVVYTQVDFDKTGKTVKWQQLTAQELKMEAQARDTAGGEPYQCVKAFGPGMVKIWQAGEKDPAGPAPNGKPMQPGAAPKGPAQPAKPADEQEMKLTVVNFSGQMTAVDKGKVFQKATFENNIRAISMPADSPTVEVQPHRLPPRSTLLNCNKELIVWSHKKPNAPPVQRMDAYGNADLRTDEYDGWGETISHDGKQVILNGKDAIPARIRNRFNMGNDQSGKRIVYDRSTGHYTVFDSFGGTLNGGTGGPKK